MRARAAVVIVVSPTAAPAAPSAAFLTRSIRSGCKVEIPDVMTQSLIGRSGTPDDIARVVLFAASDLSMIMTGSTLLADAGEMI